MSKLMSFIEKFKIRQVFAGSNQEETYAKEEAVENNMEEDMEADMEKGIEEFILEKQELESKLLEKQKEEPKIEPEPQIKQNTKYTISEIYDSFEVENSDYNTVFMLGNFINALPDSLPYEVRKKSLISIVASSNVKLESLLGDGEKRLDVLKQFSNNYYNLIRSDIEGHQKKISDLKNQINRLEDQIRMNETLLREQNNIIKYETDKIEGIVHFLNSGE